MKLQIPNNWDSVTLREFINISKLDITDELSYYVNIINCFGNNITVDELSSWEDESILEITSHLNFLKEEINTPIYKEVILDKDKYGIINLNKITIGEYITIQTLLDNEKDVLVNTVDIILSVVLRKENEEFDVDTLNDKREYFKDKLSVMDAFGLVKNYYEWHKTIIYNYAGLFRQKQDDKEEEVNIDTPSISPRWRWFSIIERLANADITKFEEIYKLNYINCLNMLSYWKEKNDVEERIRRRQEMMRPHR